MRELEGEDPGTLSHYKGRMRENKKLKGNKKIKE